MLMGGFDSAPLPAFSAVFLHNRHCWPLSGIHFCTITKKVLYETIRIRYLERYNMKLSGSDILKDIIRNYQDHILKNTIRNYQDHILKDIIRNYQDHILKDIIRIYQDHILKDIIRNYQEKV